MIYVQRLQLVPAPDKRGGYYELKGGGSCVVQEGSVPREVRSQGEGCGGLQKPQDGIAPKDQGISQSQCHLAEARTLHLFLFIHRCSLALPRHALHCVKSLIFHAGSWVQAQSLSICQKGAPLSSETPLLRGVISPPRKPQPWTYTLWKSVSVVTQVSSGLGEIFWTVASCCSVWCLLWPYKSKSLCVSGMFSPCMCSLLNGAEQVVVSCRSSVA